MDRLHTRAAKVAEKIVEAMGKLPDSNELTPLIIVEILIAYKRFGLASLVEQGWNWKPKGDVEQ